MREKGQRRVRFGIAQAEMSDVGGGAVQVWQARPGQQSMDGVGSARMADIEVCAGGTEVREGVQGRA